jgi:hypothetical protein
MEQSELLVLLCKHLNRLGAPYFITGSQATIAYGEPRFTNDIDVVVVLDEVSVEDFCDGFPADEFYLNRETARAECRRKGMFNIIHPTSGHKIDVVVAKDDSYDQLRIQRARKLPIADDCEASFSSPEDIIIKKMEWHKRGGGDRHLRDIAGILKISGDLLDRAYIRHQARELGLEELWQNFSPAG